MSDEPLMWNLKPLHDEVMKMFRSFECVCEQHGWRYFAYGGTVLGALRHKGFIPWDDDFDIVMPREDYNAFTKAARKELPPNMVLKRGGVDGPIDFSRIVSVEEGVKERLEKEMGLPLPLSPFIDVFVLDGVPADIRNLNEWWRARRLLRMVQIYRFPQTYLSGSKCVCFKAAIKKSLIRLGGFFLSWFYPKTRDNDEMMVMLDELALRWPYEKSRTVAELAFFKLKTEKLVPKWYYEPARTVPFEDGTIRIPARAEDICTLAYGDYMTLPPPEHRIPEHCFHKKWENA